MNEYEGQKAIIYCRVSDPKQKKNGHGLESQETRCREFAAYQRLSVVDVFCDDFTGKTSKRPGMKEMLTFLRRHRQDHYIVLVDDISRVARHIVAHHEIRDSVRSAGGIMLSPTLEFKEDSDSMFRENILASSAQHQREKNREQVLNRMRARTQNGYWCFQPPTGYRYAKNKQHGKLLVPNEPVASIIREALEGFASGRFGTQSEVRQFLERQPEFPKIKGKVHKQRIPEILSRVLYAGYIEMPEWNVPRRKGHHKPLISYETFLKVQERQQRAAHAPARKDFNEDFPLRGFVVCADCDTPYRAGWTKGRSTHYAYYACHNRDCSGYGKSIKRSDIEGEFEELLRKIQPTKELFEAMHVVLRKLWDEQMVKAKAGATNLKAEYAKLEKQAEKLIDMMMETNDEMIRSRYEKRLRQIENEKIGFAEKAAARSTLHTRFDVAYRTAMGFLENPLKLWLSGHYKAQQMVLKLVFCDQLQYARNGGYRTAATSMPFKLFERLTTPEEGMVELSGFEPLASSLRTRRSTN